MDLETLQKCENWLKIRASETPSDGGKKKLVQTLLQELRDKIADVEIAQRENGIKNHKVYRVHFSTVHLNILRKVFAYCVQNKTHIIEKSKIPGLTHTDYWNFCFLQRFGFIYYLEEDGKRKKDGSWGVAVKRIYQFLTWSWKVAAYSERNTETSSNDASEERITINQIKRYKPEQLEKDNKTHEPYFIEYLKIESQF